MDFLNPDFWLACSAASGTDHGSESMRNVADHLENTETFVRVGTVYRKIFRDFSVLRQNLVDLRLPEGEDSILTDGGLSVETMLAILHGIRLALMGEIFRIADRIPEFASVNGMNRSNIISRIFHLDVPGAVRDLESIFPKGSDESFYEDKIFNEVATYIVDESQSYESEHATIFRPMMRLYDLNCRVSAAVTHLIGAFG